MVTDIQEVYQEDIGCLEAGDWRERIVTNNTNITPSFNLQREEGREVTEERAIQQENTLLDQTNGRAGTV